MSKKRILLLFVFSSMIAFSQKNSEKFPVFPSCENSSLETLENCFYNEVQSFVYANYKISSNLGPNYKGEVLVLFEVNDKGMFQVQYVDANDEELIAESKRVFSLLPKIKPPTYNGKPTYSKYTIRIAIPLSIPVSNNITM